jgi:sugar/nucleoside kinase (ribokinase family)
MMQLIVVGSVALDSIETPFGRLEDGLGGSATFFSLSASHFALVGLVGVVGSDFPENHERILSDAGVDLAGFRRIQGDTFRWTGAYGYDLNVARTLTTELNVFADFDPSLPAEYRKAPFVFLANIDPELQLRVLEQAEQRRFVACDTMNFWIERKRPALLETLRHVDALLINDSEARELAGHWNIVKAISAIHRLGPRVVVVKRGEYGALLSTGNGYFYSPAYPLEEVKDPTGAGDSFAGGFMGYLARRGHVDDGSLRQAVISGSVMASFCVEDFSTRRLERLVAAEIRERARTFRELMDPQPIASLV